MALNNFHWSTEQGQPKRVGGKLEVYAHPLLFIKVDVVTQRIDRMNVNAANSSAPYPCETCGSIEYVTLNCQVGSPFSYNSPTLNHIYLFNEAMLLIFHVYLSHLTIPVGKIHFGPHFAI